MLWMNHTATHGALSPTQHGSRQFGRPCWAGVVASALGRGVPLGERLTVLLLGAIALLSLGDLVMTLQVASSMGMVEVNPVARALMATGSPLFVVAWKCATVALACGILYHFRRAWAAQLGAWVGFLVLVWLTVHWAMFINEMGVHTSIETWVNHGDPR